MDTTATRPAIAFSDRDLIARGDLADVAVAAKPFAPSIGTTTSDANIRIITTTCRTNCTSGG